jgi:hypothetical protein
LLIDIFLLQQDIHKKMSTELERVSAQLDSLVNALPDSISDGHLKSLSTGQFLKLCETVRSRTGWEKQQAVVTNLQNRFLDLCTDPAKLIETVLTVGTTCKSLDQHRKHILNFLIRQKNVCETEMIKRIWQANLPWTIAEANKLPQQYFLKPSRDYRAQCMIKTFVSTAGQARTRAYSDDDHSNIPCTAQELLLVACLMYRDDLDADRLLTLYAAWCSPALYHLPLKVKQFKVTPLLTDFDLMETVHAYYSGAATVSPAVRFRRNVHTLVGNHCGQVKEYSSPLLHQYSSSITLECPYMCYIVPEMLVIELDGYGSRDLTEESFRVTCGTEYLLMNPVTSKDKCTKSSADSFVVHKEVDCERPCVYLTVSTTSFQNLWWKSLKVYGRAVCFV